MSTNYHTPIPSTGAKAKASTFNDPMGELDAAVTAIAAGAVDFLQIDGSNSKTISGGSATPTTGFLIVDTEGAAASDDLDTVVGGLTGMVLFIRCANAARVVTITHNVGNFKNQNGVGIVLNDTDLYAAYLYDGTDFVQFNTITAAPKEAKYLVQVADSVLTNEQALSSLATGAMVVTTTTGVVTSLKHNLAGGAAPGATDDSAAGYAVGSLWVDTTNDLSYICVDATATAAVWDGGASAAGGGFGREGLPVNRISDSTLIVGTGKIEINGTTVTKAVGTFVNLATAANWIGGSSLETADEWVHVYIDASGNLLLSDKQPIYPVSALASQVADMRVNQVGWIGTSGFGLNATSVVYDADTDEGDIVAGMWVAFYSDASFTLGRGKGSAAAAAVTELSLARITAVDTGTNTLTLEAGHQTAIFDNDYMIVLEAGNPNHRYDGATWYRWVDCLWNDSSGHLVGNNNQYGANRSARSHSHVLNESSNYSTSSSSFVDIDATTFGLTIITSGGDIQIGFEGFLVQATGGQWYLDIDLNGTRLGGDDGLIRGPAQPQTGHAPVALSVLRSGLPPGTHYLTLQWKVSANSATLYAGAGTGTLDVHPQFWAKEV